MRERRKVSVTEEDIEKGKPNSCGHCPVRRAIARSFPEISQLEVTDTEVAYRNREGKLSSGDLPTFVVPLIKHYDAIGKMGPFEFHLELDL